MFSIAGLIALLIALAIVLRDLDANARNIGRIGLRYERSRRPAS
jgi:hypothetical protein